MTASRDLSALLGSRICHDLISPLGAIGNGVELLAMTPGAQSPEIALIAESVENANARIRFFRVAFGAASTEASISRGEIADILKDLTKSGRVGIDWNAEGEVSRADVKLAFLLILCLETTMPWGGQIHVGCTTGTWHIGASAERLRIEPEFWELVANPRADVTVGAAEVQFALVPDAAQAVGRSISTDIREREIKISF